MVSLKRGTWGTNLFCSSQVILFLFFHSPFLLSSVQFSLLATSDSLWPHGLQPARLPYPSPTPEACSNSCPLSQWCHPTIPPLSSTSPPVFKIPPHQGLFQWVSSSHPTPRQSLFPEHPAAAAAKSLQSCPTLCDPIVGSPPGSPVPGILQARILEWVAISFSNAWKWKVKVKSLSHVPLFETPWTAAYQAPLSLGLSRQEYWSGVSLPSLSISHRVCQIKAYKYCIPLWWAVTFS